MNGSELNLTSLTAEIVSVSKSVCALTRRGEELCRCDL
jgi:hypothetical protein